MFWRKKLPDSQTIFAPASAVGKAGVTIFRISGAEATQAVTRLCVPRELPAPRLATLRDIKDLNSGEVIDHALILYFPAPHSFTGEDVIELHTHGGRAVTNAVIAALRALPHFRLAEAGEFTRRAFENGKMDLTEAEAIADLVHAETEAQRKQALRQMDGALGKLYEDWRHRLSHSLAYVEAAIDFSDEELPEDMIEKQSAALRILRDEILNHLNDNHRGERLREGFSIAILGPPNAGKSSLLNALARREAAIVSPTAGTTRDVIEVHLDIGGYPVILADTAGLRAANDSIESEGVRRAHLRAADADLKLIVLDGTSSSPDEFVRDLIDANTIVVLNKSDIANVANTKKDSLPISALTGSGIDDLLQKLAQEIAHRFDATSAPPLTRARHRAALEECVENLARALQAQQVDMCAEDIRLAMRALGRITGRIDVEDLLDIIFRDFCIGK
jgi:tRNA modification GTPase